MDLVSVVITTYKRTIEFKRALDSVVNQTYKYIEIIVVDDNTDVKCSSYVQKVVQDYPQVLYIKNPKNLGGALSRNQGLKVAKGKFIAFLDDDDVCMSEKIQKQLECFNSTKIDNVGIVYCHTLAVDENEKIIEKYEKMIRGDFLYETMLETIAATTQWLCIRKAIIEIGGFKNVPSKQDSTLLIDLALAGYRIDVVPEFLTKYYELNIERISGINPKNLEGELILRDYERTVYKSLSSEQINKIEYNFAFRIYYLKVRLGKYNESTAELKILFKTKINRTAITVMLIKHPFRVLKNMIMRSIT